MDQPKRIDLLIERIDTIKRHFFPEAIKEDGSYTEDENLSLLAAILLIHAEVEDYMENRALEILENSRNKWETERKINKTILSIIAFSGLEMKCPPETIKPIGDNKRDKWREKALINVKLEKAIKCYSATLFENNGIKENNLLNILLPIGIDVNSIDPLLMIELNNFGEERGKIAHKSISTRQQVNPVDLEKRISFIIEGIKKIELRITELEVIP